MQRSIYFDYAAATPMLPEVTTAMQPYFSDYFYNSGGLYSAARQVKRDIQQARHVVAQAIGAQQGEIIFTAGGTEASNVAIHGIMHNYTDAHIVTCATEHESVLQPVKCYNHTIVEVDENGYILKDRLENSITSSTVLVSVMMANNEIGTVTDMKAISDIVRKHRQERQKKGNILPLYLHTDACQAVNYLDIHVARLGVDMLTLNAGKIYGPKQTGALYIRAGTTVRPLIYGGGQERGLRSGTQNVANIIGLATALKVVRTDMAAEMIRIALLQKYCIDNLQTISGVSVNGPMIDRRLVNNIHITIANKDNERIVMELDERGFQVATGSACSASSAEPSHVLRAIGLSDDASRSSIRITLGRPTRMVDCEQLIRAIKEVV